MAIRLQLRKGNTAQNNTFTGAVGELTYDTATKQLHIHDNSTAGGYPVFDMDFITPNWTAPQAVASSGFTAPSHGLLVVSGHGYSGQSAVYINGTMVWVSGNFGSERLSTDVTLPLRKNDVVTFSHFNAQFWARFYPYKRQTYK